MPFIRATTTVENIQNTITSSDAPQFPTIGQMWLDTSVTPPVVRQWNGTEWVVVHLDIKQLDPVSMDEINKIIQDTINEVNSSRGEIDEALKQAQDAVDKANIASGNVEKVTADVADAKKNAQDAIDKASLNDASITEIKKQQSEDGQKIADISQNFNGIQQSVTDLAKKQESDRTQLAGMIQDKVSNKDFEASNTVLADKIDEVISSSDGRFNAMQATIDSTTQTIKGLDDRVTQNTTSINGINTTVQNKADKTEVTQLAGQISETVENQEETNQRVATAEKNIEALTTSDGNQNKRLDTAEKSIHTISTKTDNNTELINETKKTADSNSSKIVDTSGRVSTVEQTVSKQSQTISDNTGKINKANQDIDSAKRTISDVVGRVSKVEQKADGISSTVSKVQSDLNNTNEKIDNISVGGTNLFPNSSFKKTKIEKIDKVNNSTFEIIGGVGYDDEYCLKVTPNLHDSGVIFRTLENPEENTYYTFSAYVKVPENSTLSLRNYWQGWSSVKGKNINLKSNQWTKIELTTQSKTGIADNWGFLICRLEGQNLPSYFLVDNVKIEKGNKSTDWSPAPQDYKNNENIFPIYNFEDNCLASLINTTSNSQVNIVPRPVDSKTQEAPKTGTPFKIINSSNKCLAIYGYSGKNHDVIGRDNTVIEVNPGDSFTIQFDFVCGASSGKTAVGFELSTDAGEKTWIHISSDLKDPTNWYRLVDAIEIPRNKKWTKARPFLSYINGGPTSERTLIDNIIITKNLAQNTIIKSQQTQLNQKPNRTEIIASSNDNPKAYFQLGTFSSGPNAGRGYVSVGADYGFFLKTNTFIEDGFKLSANHIDAGVICGKKPTWMNDSTTPDDFKNQSKYYPELRLATQDGDDPLSLTLYSNTTGTSGKSKTANRIQLNNEGLKFEMFNWTDAKLLNTTKPSLVKPFQDNQDPNSTGISVESGNGTGLLVQNGPAYRNVGKKVVIGYDMKSTELCAVGSSVIYTNRINSLNDSDGPEDPGITVDDVLYIDEPIASKWTQNGKRTYISYPNRNGGDVIEFHTAEGEGAFSSYKAYFQMVNGNWKSGGVDAQHHAIVVGGNGYILSFSNEDTTDNAQGNGNATVVATKFVTNSSKELKTDIRPINDIDQAVKDILKIEPKQYLYQDQVDKLKEWKDNGKPADTFKHLDTEINVGLIAEEMDEYNSLRPFIEKVSDEEGNEGILGIDYSKLTPLLLAVCQKQDNKINELEERLVRLELLMKDLHS